MFLDIDYKKRITSTKLYLAKPNKQIVSRLHESYSTMINIKLGDINEMSFSVPYKIESKESSELVDNPNIDMIREKMLVLVNMEGHKEWYVIEDIDEEGENEEHMYVTAYSLGYELKAKQISGLEEEIINPKELLEILLEDTVWNIGTIDEVFLEMYRQFESGDDSNVMNCIIEMAKTYNCLVIYDTINREVSLRDPREHGKYKGMSVDYGRLIKSIKKSRSPEELVTRMYVEGADELSIQAVNPTGQRYLEDFSYFLFPFERDENKNVIKSSYFMSDDLCNAILDHEILMGQQSPNILRLTEEIIDREIELSLAMSDLDLYNMEMENILELLDIAKATENQTQIDSLNIMKNEKQAEIDSKDLEVESLEAFLNLKKEELDNLYELVDRGSNMTPELKDELKLYIHEYTWRDDMYIDEEDLYHDAIKKFKEVREPKVIIDVSIANILNSIEEQHYWDKLVIGDYIKVSYPQMNIEYKAKIIEMNFDIDNNEVELKIANTDLIMDDLDKLAELLYSNKTATTMIENNKKRWDKIISVEDEVHKILTSEWDATKNKIIAGVRNSIEIGNRGIIIENPDFPDEILIMQSGVLALSKDRGETWKTAITPNGVVAERLIGQIVAGQNLIITNSSGTFTMDNNGFMVDAQYFRVRSSSGDKNLVDEWNKTGDFVKDFTDDNIITPYERDQLKVEWNKINIKYNYLTNLLDNYFEDGGSTTYPEVNEFHSKYIELYDYLFTTNQSDGYPIFSNDRPSGTSTHINKQDFEEFFNNYREIEPKVEELIILRSKVLQEQALQMAQEAKDMVEEIMLGHSYRVDITSTNGLIFKNNIINTRIYATVFKSEEDITSQIPDSNFKWKKVNSDGTDDTSWNAVHNGVGRYVDITSEDIYQKATFSCEIDVDID